MAYGLGAVLTSLALAAGTLASPQGPAVDTAEKPAPGSWMVVDLDAEALAAYRGGIPGLPATSPAVTGARRLDPASPRARRYLEFLDQRQRAFGRGLRRAIPGAAVGRRYDMVLGGVTVRVPRGREADVAALPGVRAAYPVERLPLLTDSTPALLGAEAAWDDLGGQGQAGEGVVVGVIDTGVWPEHPSFADPDPPGLDYAEPPAGWEDAPCEFGNADHNPSDQPFDCDGKLIAARNFQDFYRQQAHGIGAGEYDSARDADGHGTHVASTAAGNGGVDAGPLGTVSGLAPRAHLAVYKACGALGCYSADTLAAVDQAVADGVDVVNYSIAGGTDPYGDVVSLAFLDAYEAGITVVTAAGNAGPAAGTVNHLQPWTITVGATTSGRTFRTTLSVESGGAEPLGLEGASLTSGLAEAAPAVLARDYAADPGDEDSVRTAERCLEAFEPGTFDGAVVVCRDGGGPRYGKGENVLAGGAAAMVLYDPATQDPPLENHALPVVHLGADEAQSLLEALDGGSATASFPDPQPVAVEADTVAPFSGRGGPLGLAASKPDVTAPGVGVLAAHTPEPSSGPSGHLFRIMQGTSMATPHVTGAAALLVQAHPEWSPAQVRSALVLTAEPDVRAAGDAAGPFDTGSGRVRADRALHPPLVIDETGPRLADLEERPWEANAPGVTVTAGAGTLALARTFGDATGSGGTWTVSAEPAGLGVTVPGTLEVPAGGSATMEVAVDFSALPVGAVRHGRIVLDGPGGALRLPLTLRRVEPDLAMTATCSPTDLDWGEVTDCAVSLTNAGAPDHSAGVEVSVPSHLRVREGSITGGASLDDDRLRFTGTVPGAPGDVEATVASGGWAHGYQPLAEWGGAVALPVPALGDDAFANVALPDGEAVSFAGFSYDTVGVHSNGYLVLGPTDQADVRYGSNGLPGGDRPDNVLAPFWTDLDPSAGGTVGAALVDAGGRRWLAMEWLDVPNWGAPGERNSFQAWIALSDPDLAYFVYGEVTGGAWNGLAVGAENATGTRGQAVHPGGPAPAPTNGSGYAVRVTGEPEAPAQHEIRFRADAVSTGSWTLPSTMTASAFAGTQRRTVSGSVAATVPGAPRDLRVTPGDGRLTARWQAPASDGGRPIQGYRVRATPDGGEVTVGAGAREVTLDGLAGGTTYTVRVRAFNAVGSGPEASRSATPSAPAQPDPEPTEPDPPVEDPPLEVERVAGQDRFATAATLSARTFEPGVPVAYVATGLNFPDALAGSAAAGFQGGPVLLTLGSRLPDVTAQELRRLRPARVVVLGGDAVVSPAVLDALRPLAPEVERLAGPDRFATAAAVSRAAFAPGVPVAYVATADNFPDALAGSAVAAAAGGPVLLVSGSGVPAATHDELARLRPRRIVALGGSGVVPSGVLAQLTSFAPVGRLAGPDRFATAAATALDAFDGAVPVVHVATGNDYPDALAGSAAAAAQGGPVLLVREASVPEATAAALDELDPDRIAVLGGTGAVADGVVTALRER